MLLLKVYYQIVNRNFNNTTIIKIKIIMRQENLYNVNTYI